MRSDNIKQKCSLSSNDDFSEMCIVPQFPFYLGYTAALWSRLAEIGIRTTFIVFTLISALLFEALDERMKKISEKSPNNQEYSQHEMAVELDELRSHYDLVCQLVEQINRSFGLVLLLITGHDFAIAIVDFNNILDHLKIGQKWFKEDDYKYIFNEQGIPAKFKWSDFFYDPLFENKFIFLRSDPIKTCQFAQPVLRFLLLLVVSHRVGAKVSNCNNFKFIYILLFDVLN